MPATLLKRASNTGFPVNISKSLKTVFLQKTFGDCFD